MAIQRFKGENYGSLITIDYIAVSLVKTFLPTNKKDIALAGIEFYAGADWQRIYCTQDTMGHKQPYTSDDNGGYYLQSVVGFIPGDEDEIEDGLRDLDPQQRYLVRVTRPNGIIKIVGTPDQPLNFVSNSDSQNTVPGRAGTAITFSGKTLLRAYTVTP